MFRNVSSFTSVKIRGKCLHLYYRVILLHSVYHYLSSLPFSWKGLYSHLILPLTVSTFLSFIPSLPFYMKSLCTSFLSFVPYNLRRLFFYFVSPSLRIDCLVFIINSRVITTVCQTSPSTGEKRDSFIHPLFPFQSF